MNKVVKIIIEVVLLAAICGLVYLLYSNIMKPVNFNKERDMRKAVAVQRLQDIRTLQVAHKSVTGEGIVHGADLHHDLHLAVLIELLQGVHGGVELAGDGLVGDLQGTDVLETLYGDSLAGLLLLVEVDRLHDVAVEQVHETDNGRSEDKLNDNLYTFVHCIE